MSVMVGGVEKISIIFWGGVNWKFALFLGC